MSIHALQGNFSREGSSHHIRRCLTDGQRKQHATYEMLSILRKARLKDKEMRILMLCVLLRVCCLRLIA